MKQTYNLALPFDFLKKISKNNNKEWFTKNKPVYQEAHIELVHFADALLEEMNKHDSIETPTGKKSLYRIYNDIRFSKDKNPYKNNIGGGFRRATKQRRGGYYFHIEPNNSFVAGGFFSPNAEDLLHIRNHLSADPKTLKKILNEASFKKTFNTLLGDKVKTAPRGFDIEDENIELIRHKQFLAKHTFTNEEVLSKNFHILVSNTFKKMRPYLDYMSEILTTDLNGESVDSSQ
jgi:uncharacterized protein (TIGR02453 family)